MKYLILISVLLFAIPNANAQYSREEAIEIIKEEVIGLDSLHGRHLYSKIDMLNQGDTIYMEYYWGNYVNSFEEAWAFFIDDAPIANWHHPCRLVFFDVNSGNCQTINESYAPYPFFQNIHQYWDEWEWVVYNEVTRAEALDFVTTEIIGQDSLEYKQLFSRYEELMYNDTLWMDGGEYYHYYSVYKAWAFFIDDLPIAYWAHPCRVVIVNSYPGFYNYYYSITEDQWPPYPYFEDWNLFLEQWQWITTVDIPENDLSLSESKLFPNPCKDEISIQCIINPGTTINFYISDLTGKTVKQMTSENQSEIIKFNRDYNN